ncbi:hypothetical protein FSARC_11980 [Fusarium sarcochroum]|uniref:Beta-glucosidase cel3A n=1 Tax=Fusarium sarcochroum TaxID=1208366 RepID=A0A8H4TBR7_9HYPO|nr:hypothetical protein FSARC_11980 [Fusarium sarcochroum]
MSQRIDIQHGQQGTADRDFPLSFLDTYFMPVDVVFVIEGFLDKDRLCKSLSNTLSIFPPVYGRFKPPSSATKGELSLHLYHPIPVFWQSEPKDTFEPSAWKQFIKRIATKKILKGQAPLLQVTVTYQPQTSQTILGRIPPRSQQFSPTLGSKLKAYGPLVHAIVFKTLEYARFNISAQDLGILAQKTRSRLHPVRCSTQDAFKAYLLKALNRFVYNGLTAHPRVTRIVTIVDARKGRDTSETYFGNCITAAYTPYLPASKSLSDIAFAVREGVTSISPEKLAKGDEWIQAIQGVNGLMDLTPAFDQDTLYVDDWTKVSMEEVHFGQLQVMFCQPLEVEALPVRNCQDDISKIWYFNMYRLGLAALFSLALPVAADPIQSNGSSSAIDTTRWLGARAKADSWIAKMTLKEKSLMVTGTFDGTCIEYIAPIERIGFSGLCIQDGPIGLRLGDLVSVFPSGVTTAATWDKQLMALRGEAMAEEFIAKGAHVLLGPVAGALGRSPYGGRNWEGFSPDPYLTGIAMDETIRAIQEKGVQATAKHLIANEQETQRKPTSINGKLVDAVSSNVDDRTMHELYLWPFADAVHAGVSSVMCGYNRINGTYSCENKHLINNLLKKELGFEGYVMSDFLTTPPGLNPIKAGLDMNQPGPVSLLPLVETYWGDNLVSAVKNGTLAQSELDGMVRRILTPYFYLGQDKGYPSVDPSSTPLVYNSFSYPIIGPSPVGRDVRGNHSALIREVAAAGTVLLKNDNSILPLNKSLTNIGVFGNDAADPSIGTLYADEHGIEIGTLISGGGSGSGRPSYIVSPLDAFKAYAKENDKRVQYVTNNTAIAKGTMSGLYPWPEVCIVFLKSFVSEGFDRKTLLADDDSVEVVNSIASRCPRRTIVVTHSGGPDVMPWATNPNVSAIVAAHFPGQESGNSIMDVLTGKVNPSGKLPYTITKKEEDYNGKIVNITGAEAEDGSAWQSDFTEGLLIDYRHFDQKNVTPLYEFGYGLSYTAFDVSSDLTISTSNKIPARSSAIKSNTTLALGGNPHLWDTVVRCSVEVSNTGRVAGATVVQLYAALPKKNIPADTPIRTLRGFEKVHLEPGESKEVTFNLKRRDLSYWDVSIQDWVVPKGDIVLSAGFSSRDLKTSASVNVAQ